MVSIYLFMLLLGLGTCNTVAQEYKEQMYTLF